MPFEQHQEKKYTQDSKSVYNAALKATAALEGKVVIASPEKLMIEAKFPKTILGNLLGDRTHLTCQVTSEGEGSLMVVDAYPLDAVERKLMFGARKGVTQTVVGWFIAHTEHNLGIPAKS